MRNDGVSWPSGPPKIKGGNERDKKKKNRGKRYDNVVSISFILL